MSGAVNIRRTTKLRHAGTEDMSDQNQTEQSATPHGVGSGDLLACDLCEHIPEIFPDGEDVIVQCRLDCNTVCGPREWAIQEWNSSMKQANDQAEARRN